MRSQKTTSGFSLLEALFTMGIFVLVTVSVSSFIMQSYKTTLFADEQAEAIEQARRGMTSMVKEIREASPAENGAFPLELADAQNIIFYSDIDSDEEIERVHYYLSGTDLVKGVMEPSGFPPACVGAKETTVLSHYVQNGTEPVFSYFNGDYPTDTT